MYSFYKPFCGLNPLLNPSQIVTMTERGRGEYIHLFITFVYYQTLSMCKVFIVFFLKKIVDFFLASALVRVTP
tara:strand:- start:1 stop:219 length:219 start_codon:yes stop_codon:yes gene_type:complete